MRKLSLLFAAALMACVFQTAYAEESPDVDESPAFAQQDEFCPGGRCGPGRRGMMWRGGRGHGPAMPFMHQGFRGDGPGRGQRMGMDGGMHFGMLSPRFMEELDLTADQKTKIIDTATENFRERLELRWEMAEARNTLNDLNEADTPDYDAIVAANEALGSVKGKLDVARRKIQEQFTAILTPEQREKIDELQSGWRQNREDRKGPRDRGDRPGKNDPRFQRGPGPRR